MLKKRSFTTNATMLAIGGIICKIIGAVYRIPLVKILGTTGIGLYQTAFPIFSILLTLSSGGISQTVSILSSSEPIDTKGIVRAGFSVVAIATAITSILLFLLAPVLAQIQGVPESADCYLALIPALIFSGFSAVIKGDFQSKSNVTPTFISQFIEQGGKLFFGLSLASLFIDNSQNGVVGALLGVSISELLCFLFLFIRYILRRGKEKSTTTPRLYTFVRLLRASLPLSLAGIILPLSSLVDSVSIVNLLSISNSKTFATSMYGILSGVVYTITNLPAVFTVALGVTVVPIMGANNGTRVLKKGDISVKLALLVCIPCSLFLAILSPEVISLLYPSMTSYDSSVASTCLIISSFSILPLGITQIYSSLLFSVGLTQKSIKNLLLAVAIKCLLLFPLVKYFGIYGASASTVVCYVIASILNAKTWYKLDHAHQGLAPIGRLFISSAVCVFPVFLAKYYLSTYFLFALLAISVVLYLYMVGVSGALSKEELQSIPFLKPFTKKEGRKT